MKTKIGNDPGAFLDDISLDDTSDNKQEVARFSAEWGSVLSRFVYITAMDRFFDTRTGDILNLEAVGNLYAHVWHKPKAHTKLLADPRCKKVDGMAYWPGVRERIIEHAGRTVVNNWRPSTLKLPDTVTDNDVSRWLELVEYLVPDERDRQHLIQWMAAVLQQQHRKINHAVLLAGRERIGKDTIIQPLIYGLGTWNVTQPLAEELLEPYTDYLDAAKLVVFQEVQNFEKLSIQNKLKPMLASPPDTLRVRLFQRGYYETPNICQCLFMSNHKDALKLSENDPRYFAIWCDRPRLPDAVYEELYAWLNDGGYGQVVRWLLDQDISSFNFTGPAPNTDFKREIRELGRTALETELADKIERRVPPFDIDYIRTSDVCGELRNRNANIKNVGHALGELGCVQVKGRIVGSSGKREKHTLWIIREYETWQKADFSQMVAAWEAHYYTFKHG